MCWKNLGGMTNGSQQRWCLWRIHVVSNRWWNHTNHGEDFGTSAFKTSLWSFKAHNASWTSRRHAICGQQDTSMKSQTHQSPHLLGWNRNKLRFGEEVSLNLGLWTLYCQGCVLMVQTCVNPDNNDLGDDQETTLQKVAKDQTLPLGSGESWIHGSS